VSTLEIRPLSLDDDLAAQLDLGERAFGVMPPADREAWRRGTQARITAGRVLGAFLDGRPVGSASWHDMRQWWAGRALPMAGVASVKVAPEARGQGLGRQLMTEVLREIAARGYPLSALYPATMPIYRSLGWELAGSRYLAAIPARSLRPLAAPDPALTPNDSAQVDFRRVTPGDGTEVIDVLGRAHEASRDCGPVTRDVDSVEQWLASADTYRYISDDAFLAYRWHPGNGGLTADWAVAATPAAQRALWSILAGHSSTADTVEVRTWPGSPIWWLLRERDARLVKLSMWMLRVVDAPSAVACRGFGTGLNGSVRIHVADPVMPENAGTWELIVAGGAGKLERAEAGPEALTVGARGLAALYAGTPLPTLRMAGLAVGGSPEDDWFLSAAFPGPAWMIDDF
jgi:predicted acetyltransferase